MKHETSIDNCINIESSIFKTNYVKKFLVYGLTLMMVFILSMINFSSMSDSFNPHIRIIVSIIFLIELVVVIWGNLKIQPTLRNVTFNNEGVSINSEELFIEWKCIIELKLCTLFTGRRYKLSFYDDNVERSINFFVNYSNDIKLQKLRKYLRENFPENYPFTLNIKQ